MASILRVLPDPALLADESEPQVSKPQKADTKGAPPHSKDTARNSRRSSTDAGGKLSRKASGIAAAEPAASPSKHVAERRQMIEIDEEEPLVAKLPAKLPPAPSPTAGTQNKPPKSSYSPSKQESSDTKLSVASGHTSQGAEMRFDAIYDSSREVPSIVSQLKQWMSPQIAQRNNVVALFTGHGKENGISAEFDAVVNVIFESLRGAVISATEAHQEMLAVMSDENTSLRGKISHLEATREGAAGSMTNNNSPNRNGMNGIPELSPDGGEFIRSDFSPSRSGHGGSYGGGYSAPASPDMYNSRRAQSAMTAGSSRSKYSLLMARLPRNSAELEVTQLINVARPLLPRLTGHTASHRASVSNGPDGEGTGSPSKVFLRYMRSKSPIGTTAGALTGTTKGNGTKGLIKAVRTLPGYLAVPYPQEIHEACSDIFGFSIHLWVKAELSLDTDRSMTIFHAADQHEQQFMIRLMANTSDVATFERGQMLLTCRDSHGKYIESLFNCDVCDGEWHQLGVFINPKNKTLAMALDGRNCRSRLLSTDDVTAFDDPRRRFFYIGASPTEDHKNGIAVFAGYVMDFETVVKGNQLVQHYPISKNEAACEQDELRKDSEAAAAIFSNIECEETMFSKTAPHFDGRSNFINVGSLGDWGFIRNGTSIEFKVRLSNSAESMCVMGVTDITGKHGGFGVEFNTGIHNTLQRYHMLVWATDYDGNSVRAAVDLSSDTYDDRWHSISIRLNDISMGKFKIRLDNRPLETQTAVTAEIPMNFTTYSTHVTIGCLNNRGRHERFFKGGLRNIKLSHLKNEEEEFFGHWLLDEGPHARIAFDHTSHGYSGSFEHIAKEREMDWYPIGDDDDAADQDYIDISKLNVTRHNHNQVSVAIIAVNTLVNPRTGRTYEVLEDILNNTTLNELETVPLRDFNNRIKQSDTRVFKTIPEDCFRNTDSADYLTVFRQGLVSAREHKRAHIIVVFRLGDAMFTAVDFAEFTKSDKARLIVTPNHMTWSDVTNTDGSVNKTNIAINSQLSNTEKLLLQIGMKPQLYKRSRFIADLETASRGPDMLSSILLFSLLASQETSRLFFLQYLPPKSTHDEALHSLLLAQGMRMADQSHAALIVTKAWRARLGRNIYHTKVKLRDEAQARKSRADTLRKQYQKETVEKRIKHALIIKATEFFHDRIMQQPICETDDVEKAVTLLQGMGFLVEQCFAPSVETLWKALRTAKQNQAKVDSMLLVYYIGFGAHDVYTQPPTVDQQLSWVEEAESLARTELLSEHHQDWLDAWVTFWSDLYEIHSKEMAIYEDLTAKKAKKKKKKVKGPEEIIFKPQPLPHKDSNDSVKRGLMGWALELSPPVARRSAEYSNCRVASASPAMDASFNFMSASALAPFGNTMSFAATANGGSHGAIAESTASLFSNRSSPRNLNGTMNAPSVTPRLGSPLDAGLDSADQDTNAASTRSPASPNIHDEPSLMAQTYLLAADSAAPFDSNNTILLSEIKNYIVGPKPKRGEHSIFLYDCATIPSPTITAPIGGFGGFVGASGEALHTVYKPDQKHTIGYYFLKCFVGAAVECVRIGRHPTEPNVTLETASHYISNKLGKDSPCPTKSLHIKWFGEYIGDCFLAPSLLTSKDERRVRKQALSTKKVLTVATIRWTGTLTSEFKASLQNALGKMCKSKSCEIRRLSIDDVLTLTYSASPQESNGCDYNALTRHPIAQEKLKADLKSAFSDAPNLTYKLFYSHPQQICVSILPPAKEKGTTNLYDEGGKDGKTAAQEFVADLEKRNALVEEHIVSNGLAKFSEKERTVAGGKIRSASIIIRCHISITEDDGGKLERLSRRNQSAFSEAAHLIGVHVLTEKEIAAYDNEEKLFALDEQRKQTETKLRLAKEAEVRRKAEEARQKMLEKRDQMLDVLRQCKAAGKIEQDDFELFFSVPLLDAFLQVLEALNSMLTKQFIGNFSKFGLMDKIEKMLTVDMVPATTPKPQPPAGVNVVTDQRLLLSTWKLVLGMAQGGFNIMSKPTFQTLVTSTFGGYNSQNLNVILIRVATQALTTCDTAAKNPNCIRPSEYLVVDPSNLAAAASSASGFDSSARRNSSTKRTLFNTIMKRWPLSIPTECKFELENAIVIFAPSIVELMGAVGVVGMSVSANVKLTSAADGVEPEAGDGGEGASHHHPQPTGIVSDDDYDDAFSKDAIYNEVLKRCKDGYLELVAQRKAEEAESAGDQQHQQQPTSQLTSPRRTERYTVSARDLHTLLDMEAPPLSIINAIVYASSQMDPTVEPAAQDAIEYLTVKVLWTKELAPAIGPVLKTNPHLDSLRKRLASQWPSDTAIQVALLTEEERAPPPPPPPPPVVEAPKRGARRR